MWKAEPHELSQKEFPGLCIKFLRASAAEAGEIKMNDLVGFIGPELLNREAFEH